ncbi:hypothetical protein ACFE04_003007 [Oxalis oulophora]
MNKWILLISWLIHLTVAQRPILQKPDPPPPMKKWLTLKGDQPVVIARGGLSGIFPESSQFANDMAIGMSLNDVALFCNLQLTKDGAGICLSGPTLDNSTDIADAFPQGEKTYEVNGQQIRGWFSIDYESDIVFNNISLVQNVLSRPGIFDGLNPVTAPEDILGLKPPKFWLNVQYDLFYAQHKLSVAAYIQAALRTGLTYLSSPEINFLKAIGTKVNKVKTKLIFVFQQANVMEPTTKRKYGDIIKDLASIKTFAAGILVPKEYIYPVDAKYLQPPTNLVTDAHKLGLEVYAAGFANDMPASYNYSYDPTAEYLQFIDNSLFAVDGFLTDFSPTASESIACLANNNVTKPVKGKELNSKVSVDKKKPNMGTTLIITRNGASGIYPPCTNLAYQKAIDDGADIIDCSVQMSKDGVAFCLNSADLMGDTTAVTTFISRSNTVPEIQPNNGIFSFDLTWNEIQTLKPQIESPYGNAAGLMRDPANKNVGKFTTLSDFLELAKTKAVSGILINIQNAAFLASKKGLGVVDVVAAALTNATFDKQSTQQVLIQSDDTSVLSRFANVKTYQRVLSIEKQISDAPKPSVDEIKKYADAVTLPRSSLITIADGFAKSNTSVTKEMHSANISVYVSVMRNEFVAIPYDCFSDPVVELATFIEDGADGVVTEFPGTASKYLRSPCADPNNEKLPYNILPAEPGQLLGIIEAQARPPADPPAPVLEVADVVDPPLPAVSTSTNTPDGPPAPSGGFANMAKMGFSLATIILTSLLLLA